MFVRTPSLVGRDASAPLGECNYHGIFLAKCVRFSGGRCVRCGKPKGTKA
jgi:hypothetical protein